MTSDNRVVNFIARHVVFYSCMFSVAGRNIQLCSERFKLSVSKLIDRKCNLHVIESVCRSAANPTMLHQCAVVWELMLARDNLVHISDLSGCSQWCVAKNGGGYTHRGVAKGLKVPC